jgi:hypothetical protein
MSEKPGVFTKGDKRINRKGRPRTFDELRDLAQQIAHETITTTKGEKLTVAEAIMRSWAQSKDPRLVQAFIAYAYGSPPTKTEVTGANGEPLLKDVTDVISKLLPDTTTD